MTENQLQASIIEIPLTKGKVAIVDIADYEWLSQHKWYAQWSGQKWYAARRVHNLGERSHIVFMHREIVEAGHGTEVDHKDGDGLHNTRANLRLATRPENMWNRSAQTNNTSGYKGVGWNKDRRKWQAQINVRGKYKYLGLFEDVRDAANAYDAAARELHGEYARTNND